MCIGLSRNQPIGTEDGDQRQSASGCKQSQLSQIKVQVHSSVCSGLLKEPLPRPAINADTPCLCPVRFQGVETPLPPQIAGGMLFVKSFSTLQNVNWNQPMPYIHLPSGKHLPAF
jgi:hypothetical protein